MKKLIISTSLIIIGLNAWGQTDSRNYKLSLDFSVSTIKLINKKNTSITKEETNHYKRLDRGKQYAVNLLFKRRNTYSYGVLFSMMEGNKGNFIEIIDNIERSFTEQVKIYFIGPTMQIEGHSLSKKINYHFIGSIGYTGYIRNGNSNFFSWKYKGSTVGLDIRNEILYSINKVLFVGIQFGINASKLYEISLETSSSTQPITSIEVEESLNRAYAGFTTKIKLK
ncbi:hypothetical protein OAC51_09315 [Flavobacteriaceae bacterium]|nr:hypothetical protein [Flavobacteriaceae bacterium]